MLAARCRDFDRDDLLQRLIAADVLSAPIHEIPEVAADVQVRHNEMIVPTEHATLGRLEVTGVPIKLRGTPGSVRLAPPVHGQHTVELLTELGFGADAIARYVDDRTVGRAKPRGGSD
jgi:crotonobetainyl-CoA:carnitine CoA-transferase CaiB-like acyl-CoA transferase